MQHQKLCRCTQGVLCFLPIGQWAGRENGHRFFQSHEFFNAKAIPGLSEYGIELLEGGRGLR